MTLGVISFIIFLSEIFLELKPRMFEWNIVQFPSLFIKLGFLQCFSEFLFPRLVLLLTGFSTGTEHPELGGIPFVEAAAGSTGSRLE